MMGINGFVDYSCPNCGRIKSVGFAGEPPASPEPRPLECKSCGARRVFAVAAVRWSLRRHSGGRIESFAAARRRRGFTLVELLAVLAIIGVVVGAVAGPLASFLRDGGRLDAGARLVQGQLAAALAEAQAEGFAGVRLLPDPAFPIQRTAGGAVDPAAPLAFDRLVPLVAPPGQRDGVAAIGGAIPSGLVPAGPLVLEQVARTSAGVVNDPTSWAWSVRLGDVVEVAGRELVVCGPAAVGPAAGNVEGFVTYPPGGSGLVRGKDQVEYLLLCSRGQQGWNGRDEDHDGTPDDADEWVVAESWGVIPAGVVSYAIRRRPAPAPASSGVQLAGVVVDATGWASADPPRSRLPVDPWTGAVDLVFDASGRVEPSRSVRAPSSWRFYHLWLAPREAVAATPSAEGDARLVTLDARTGRTIAGEADAANPGDARTAAERGGR